MFFVLNNEFALNKRFFCMEYLLLSLLITIDIVFTIVSIINAIIIKYIIHQFSLL